MASIDAIQIDALFLVAHDTDEAGNTIDTIQANHDVSLRLALGDHVFVGDVHHHAGDLLAAHNEGQSLLLAAAVFQH